MAETNVVIIGTDRDRIFIRLYLTVVNNGRNTFPISFYSHIGNGNSLVRRNDEYIHVLGNQFPNLRYLSAAVVHSIIYHQLYVAVIGGLNLHFEQYGFAPGIGGTLRKTNDVLFVSFLFGLARDKNIDKPAKAERPVGIDLCFSCCVFLNNTYIRRPEAKKQDAFSGKNDDKVYRDSVPLCGER